MNIWRIVLVALAVTVGCASDAVAADVAPLPAWLAGSYTGLIAGFPTPCYAGLEKTREEAIIFNIALDNDSIVISFTSPYGNPYRYTAPVVRDGSDIVLHGSFETSSRLGKGRLMGRLVMTDHAVVFTHDVASENKPDCLSHAVIVGVRQTIP